MNTLQALLQNRKPDFWKIVEQQDYQEITLLYYSKNGGGAEPRRCRAEQIVINKRSDDKGNYEIGWVLYPVNPATGKPTTAYLDEDIFLTGEAMFDILYRNYGDCPVGTFVGDNVQCPVVDTSNYTRVNKPGHLVLNKVEGDKIFLNLEFVQVEKEIVTLDVAAEIPPEISPTGKTVIIDIPHYDNIVRFVSQTLWNKLNYSVQKMWLRFIPTFSSVGQEWKFFIDFQHYVSQMTDEQIHKGGAFVFVPNESYIMFTPLISGFFGRNYDYIPSPGDQPMKRCVDVQPIQKRPK